MACLNPFHPPVFFASHAWGLEPHSPKPWSSSLFFSRLGSTIYSKQIKNLSGEAAYQIEKSGFVRNNMKVKVLDFSHQIYVHFHGRKFIEANFFRFPDLADGLKFYQVDHWVIQHLNIPFVHMWVTWVITWCNLIFMWVMWVITCELPDVTSWTYPFITF